MESMYFLCETKLLFLPGHLHALYSLCSAAKEDLLCLVYTLLNWTLEKIYVGNQHFPYVYLLNLLLIVDNKIKVYSLV